MLQHYNYNMIIIMLLYMFATNIRPKGLRYKSNFILKKNVYMLLSI